MCSYCLFSIHVLSLLKVSSVLLCNDLEGMGRVTLEAYEICLNCFSNFISPLKAEWTWDQIQMGNSQEMFFQFILQTVCSSCSISQSFVLIIIFICISISFPLIIYLLTIHHEREARFSERLSCITSVKRVGKNLKAFKYTGSTLIVT